MAFLELRRLTRTFDSVPAVDGVCLSVEQGEFFTLLGPSGCGKTTLLRMIAGLETPDSGEVLLDGVRLSGLPPERRPLHTVFQSYALFPHLTVGRNVAFPLEMARVGAAETERRVEEALSRVRLSGFGARYPHQLSGGQGQRVALARALVNRPKLLLLDEPLAALDLKLREEMQRELGALQREVGITFVYVTHDQGEALALSDRIAVMERGRVVQVGDPASVYERPANRFVAGFIGSCNLLPASVAATEEGGLRLSVPGVGAVLAEAEKPWRAGCRGTLALRPERVRLDARAEADGAENLFAGVLCDRLYLGQATLYRVRLGEGALLEFSLPNAAGVPVPDPGARVKISWRVHDGLFLPEE